MLGAVCYFDPSHTMRDNAITIRAGLSQMANMSFSKVTGGDRVIAAMTPSQVVLLAFVYYCILMIAFYIMQNLSAYAQNKGLTILQWLYLLALAGMLYLCYYRLPVTVLRTLGLHNMAILWLIVRIVLCIYVTGWINAALLYLYLKSTTHA